ncbi:MAG: hypothetical protein M4D80_35980 [Myxococcota bacterium]|nr:hypothetical protein [Deltaproteobacteria bacterium]MDQ3340588.1 hypothetical protein [Myxococcota bacterium]
MLLWDACRDARANQREGLKGSARRTLALRNGVTLCGRSCRVDLSARCGVFHRIPNLLAWNEMDYFAGISVKQVFRNGL